MLLTTIDIRTGNEMSAFEVDSDNLPRPGDVVDLDPGVTWIVCGVVWKGHPGLLMPHAIRLIPLDSVKALGAVGEQLGRHLSAGITAAVAAVGRATVPRET